MRSTTNSRFSVSARRPPSESIEARAEAARFLPGQPHLHALNAGVMALNPGGAPVPVLLRQYLKLEARVLGFSVDPLFRDAIDALSSSIFTVCPRRCGTAT